MMHLRIVKIFFVVALMGIAVPCSFAQGGDDSVELSKAGKNAKADEIYFEALKAKIHNDDKEAVTLLLQYIALRPDVSAAYYELCRLSYAERNINKAEEYIKKAVEVDPKNKWYKEEYAGILADKSMFAEAAKVVVELAQAYPQDPSYPPIIAEYYDKAKKYDEALVWLDKALLRNSKSEELLMHKVQICLAMNNVDKAADIVKQMIADEPQNGKYYHLLGDLYDNNKQPDKAKAVYDQASRIIPGDPEVQFGIASHYLSIGDTSAYIEAIRTVIINKDVDPEVQIEIFTKYIQTLPNDSTIIAQGLPIIRQLAVQHPDDADILLFYGDFLERNRHSDSAVVILKRAAAIKPGEFRIWESLLSSYAEKKTADSLVKYSEKAMRLFPNIATVSYFNGLGHYFRKEYAAAINAVKRAIDMEPETEKGMLANMYSLLGDIYHANKQDDLSDKAYDKALEMDPGNATVMNNYAYFLSERGVKLDQAERMSQKSLEMMPNLATFLDTYGWIEYKKGNYLKAKDFIERAIKQSGADADATMYDHLGNILYQLNDKAGAVTNWKIAKEKGGDDPLIDKKISEGKLYE